MMKQVTSSSSMMTVVLHIHSNWGHEDYVGLTEVSFYDLHYQKLEVVPSDISVVGAKLESANISVLCNGKAKTVRERNMWTCARPRDEPISITFVLRKPATSGDDFGLSKIKLWNYNKSISELCIGVQDLVIDVNDVEVYRDKLDKGCGNQVFNYSKDITIKTSLRQLSAPPQVGNNVHDAGNEVRHKSANPSIENVAYFNSVDILSSRSHLRSQTGLSNQDVPEKGITAITESKSVPTLNQKKKVSDPAESKGEPKSRRKKHKDRGSKMAARLDGSHCSSVDSSLTSPCASVEKHSLEIRQQKSGTQRKGWSKTKFMPTENGDHECDLTPQLSSPPEISPLSAIPGHLSPADPKSNAVSCPKPASPYFSDEDNRSMLQQLRKITSDCRPSSKDLPSWLNKYDAPELLPPPSSRDKQANKEEDILENWPTAGVPHLPTMLDDLEEPKPKAAVTNDTKCLSIQTVKEDSGRSTPSRMKEIEHKRAEWKKKEQFQLEESWTSLNLFNRSQKGRISLDLQKDILDEYLLQEKIKPSQPTIAEEVDANALVDEELAALNQSGESFVIPELPMGRDMVINILTTWGDHHYVGLNGIEVFTSTGEPANVASITADPSDINVLPEYNKDPRVVTNLVNGINRTHDDTHMWLAPFTRDREHNISITFDKPIQIAMMRIWNYNKSRIHSYRGAKDIEIMLDGHKIFEGEIMRACGGIEGSSEGFGETILFTMEEDILELVSKYDTVFEDDLVMESEELAEEEERPLTADGGQLDTLQRPFTSAAHGRIPAPSLSSAANSHATDGAISMLKGQVLCLNFVETWGDPYYLGLTGLEVIGHNGESLAIDITMLDADPRDLHILPGYETDDRTLDKLIDGNNITTSDEHMWLIPYTMGEDHLLTINLSKPVDVIGLRVWNYNKSPEDTYRGAKIVHIMLDDQPVSPSDGFLIRKGPGNCFFDFAQEINFMEPQTPRTVVNKKKVANNATNRPCDSLVVEEPSQEYEVVQKPCGFIYQLQLLTTWGDPYYVGLNGVEFYDGQGNMITLEEGHISAYPDSVNVLDGVENDVRTPDKLINGENDTTDGRHMWLAPVLPSILNRVYVIFDTPMEISMIKIWNYSKTPNRGVKDFALLVDDLLVYNGVLDMVTPNVRGILPNCEGPQKYHTVLFTSDKSLLQHEKHTIIKNKAENQDVQLTNDRQVVATYCNPKNADKGKMVDQTKRPKTSVPGRGIGRAKVVHNR